MGSLDARKCRAATVYCDRGSEKLNQSRRYAIRVGPSLKLGAFGARQLPVQVQASIWQPEPWVLVQALIALDWLCALLLPCPTE